MLFHFETYIPRLLISGSNTHGAKFCLLYKGAKEGQRERPLTLSAQRPGVCSAVDNDRKPKAQGGQVSRDVSCNLLKDSSAQHASVASIKFPSLPLPSDQCPQRWWRAPRSEEV